MVYYTGWYSRQSSRGGRVRGRFLVSILIQSEQVTENPLALKPIVPVWVGGLKRDVQRNLTGARSRP